MDNKDLRVYQAQRARERKEQLDKLQKEEEEYLKSEQYQRDMWERHQDLWEAKARKEGWTFERKPFISAADRQRMAEQAKQQEIAFLEEKIAALKGDV